ncbi:MAG: hypothetical protein DMF06_13725 [Verrucomicrobia bacterium]|nr:MAG: hypothetical protein DMF06_13725 [Verrucomicrobiota bacterium]
MKKIASCLILTATLTIQSYAAPSVRIRLPERFRTLEEQLFDFRVEATGLANTNATIRVLINGTNVTSAWPTPEVTTDNDANLSDNDKAWTFRAVHLDHHGLYNIVAEVTDTTGAGTDTQRVGVQEFSLHGTGGKKNFILFIGDAMGTAYRDAGRIVAKSTDNRFREGFFDDLQEMDSMPVSGMVMTYAQDRVVPDSANTATAWASGSKTVDGTLNVFPDNNDFKVNTSAATLQSTKRFALDNPRIETLWQYLKRLHGYKTGIVTTADVTDATPGGEGGYSLLRALTFDIARQYVDGVWTNGPEFDVILGGGMEHFNKRNATNSGDTRDLTADLQGLGFTYVTNRSALNALSSPPNRLLGLFYSQAGATGTGTVSITGANGNMNVAYDKLGLPRPSDETGSNNTGSSAPNFNGFTDQPFLDEMTAKAIATLNKNDAPFILMVEGASIDKQSHPNHAAGVFWDVIEFDKAVGLGRNFANTGDSHHAHGHHGSDREDTLVLVTADHDQSMHIVGVTDTTAPNYVTNTRSTSVYPRTAPPYDSGSRLLAPSNAGNNIGEVTGFPNYVDQTFSGGIYPTNTNQFQIAVGFRTGNHTGSSVPITADGAGALLFSGYFDQTDIFFKVARVLSSNTGPLDQFFKTREHFDIVEQNY